MNISSFEAYAKSLEQELIAFRHQNRLGQKRYLKKLQEALKQDLQSNDWSNGLLNMGRASTIILYHKNLQRIYHQDFFAILPDFYQMALPEPLENYIEFGPPCTMRFKCPIADIPMEVYQHFRKAQLMRLKQLGKSTLFNLSELDMYQLPKNSWYPIPIQMFATLNNQSVDGVHIDENGRFVFAYVHDKYLLPGGGMLEWYLKKNKSTKLKKLLEEFVEEQFADFYKVAQTEISAISLDTFKLDVKQQFFESYHALLDDLKLANGKYLKLVFEDMIQKKAPNPAVLLQEMIECLMSIEGDDLDHTTTFLIHQAKAFLQVMVFRRTKAYQDALDFLEQHTVMVQIPMFLDVRVLAGHQVSNVFIFSDISLAQWFSLRFERFVGVSGDDLTGASWVLMSLWEVIQQYQSIQYSHVLIVLASVLILDRIPKDVFQYQQCIALLLRDLGQHIDSFLV